MLSPKEPISSQTAIPSGTNLLSVSVILPSLHPLYKWNHIIHSLLGLTFASLGTVFSRLIFTSLHVSVLHYFVLFLWHWGSCVLGPVLCHLPLSHTPCHCGMPLPCRDRPHFHSLFICPSGDGPVGGFQFLAVVNSAAVNAGTGLPVDCVFFSLGNSWVMGTRSAH